MARSRSSFELGSAVNAAAHLKTETVDPNKPFQGVALVSFGAQPEVPALPPQRAEAPALPPPSAAPAIPSTEASPAIQSPRPSSRAADADAERESKRPPKLPDLSGVVSPIVRCEKIVEWIAEATGAVDVFIADGSGLPIAGAVAEADARLASAGLVATSVAQLAASMPGSPSPLFELHLGEAPFFQLVGFQAKSSLYLVGLTRPTPLTPRQAHAIRLACRHALGETLGGVG